VCHALFLLGGTGKIAHAVEHFQSLPHTLDFRLSGITFIVKTFDKTQIVNKHNKTIFTKTDSLDFRLSGIIFNVKILNTTLIVNIFSKTFI